MSKHDYHNDASQSDRYKILVNDKRTNSTMLGRTHSSEEMGGRYKAIHTENVIGNQAQIQYPAGAAWTRETLPPEELLGWSVEDQEPVGTLQEIQASLNSNAATVADGDEDTKSRPPLHSSSPTSSTGTPPVGEGEENSGPMLLSRRSSPNSFKRRV